MKGFKKCSNGHFYKNDLTQCTHCQREGSSPDNIVVMNSGNDEQTGVWEPKLDQNTGDNKTKIIEEKRPSKKVVPKATGASMDNRTHIEEEFEEESESGSVVVKKEQRGNRRLVGWLVTYSIDPMGIDYKIYEGRNLVGRDVDCNITVNDKTIGGKHAVILFRADEYIIQDQLTANGTYVNEEDIKYNPFELRDGDIIKMGKTIFKFRTSL